MRLFVAITLPEETKKKIYGTLVKKIPAGGFKRVEERNLHITICFIGECDEKRFGEVKEKLSKIRFKGFGAELSGVGSFGGRVMWLGVKEGEKEIESLASQISGALGIEGGKFHAHVTLCRNRDAGKKAFEMAADAISKNRLSEKIWVGEFCLMESKLSPKGPAYSCASRFSASTLLSRPSGS